MTVVASAGGGVGERPRLGERPALGDGIGTGQGRGEGVAGPGGVDALHREFGHPAFPTGPDEQVAVVAALNGDGPDAADGGTCRPPGQSASVYFHAGERLRLGGVGPDHVEEAEQFIGQRPGRRRVEDVAPSRPAPAGRRSARRPAELPATEDDAGGLDHAGRSVDVGGAHVAVGAGGDENGLFPSGIDHDDGRPGGRAPASRAAWRRSTPSAASRAASSSRRRRSRPSRATRAVRAPRRAAATAWLYLAAGALVELVAADGLAGRRQFRPADEEVGVGEGATTTTSQTMLRVMLGPPISTSLLHEGP